MTSSYNHLQQPLQDQDTSTLQRSFIHEDEVHLDSSDIPNGSNYSSGGSQHLRLSGSNFHANLQAIFQLQL